MPSVIIRPPTDILAQVAKDWKLERSRIAVLLPGFLGQLPEEAAGFPCLADREPIPGARACDVEQAAFLLQELAGVDVVVRDEPARRNGPPRQAQGVARAIL